MKKTLRIRLTDFRFKLAGYGQYDVTYISPISGKSWTNHITNMSLTDATKNADEPKIKDLNDLKHYCKINSL